MKNNSKIYIAGESGLIGLAIANKLQGYGYANIITRSHQQLDLTRQPDVENFFKEEKPEYVILAAAKVGGIQANISYPAQFLYENLAIQINVIHSAYLWGVKKLLFFGSACSYPRDCPQPMKEEYLLSGRLEPTNEAYAVAKIAGIKMCEVYNQQYATNFICAAPTNVYGPNDNFVLADSHVIPALIRRLHEAKVDNLSSVSIWGSGNQKREFIYVEDAADAAIFLMDNYDGSGVVNIGVGEDITIKQLADMIKEVVGYKGKIAFDTSKPDGIPQKLLDVSRLKNLGWKAEISLREGISNTYEWYKKNQSHFNSAMEVEKI